MPQSAAPALDQSPYVFIDGSSFLYRAHYATTHKFSTRGGQPTGACLIFTNMLRRIIALYPGCPVAVVFDAKGGSFRNQLYQDYKANRPPMPEELIAQIEPVHAIVRAHGCPLISVPGVEADDVLGSYAKACELAEHAAVICTGDKDLAQVVSDKVTLYDSMSNQRYDVNAVITKYQVPPRLIVDRLALIGDSSDNIPGMAGVGEKTAVLLLKHFDGIKDLEARLEETAQLDFKGSRSFAEHFREQRDIVHLSYELATIKRDVPLPIPLSELQPPKEDHAALIEIFTKLQFTKLFKEQQEREAVSAYEAQTKAAAKAAETAADPQAGAAEEVLTAAVPRLIASPNPLLKNYVSTGLKCILVNTKERLNELTAVLDTCEGFAFDTETDSLQPQSCRLVGLSLAVKPGECYYLPLRHDYVGCPEQLAPNEALPALAPYFADAKKKKYGHNLKFDLLVLKFAAGLEVKGVYADSMLAAHLLNSVQKVSLDDLAAKYLNYQTITFKDITGGKKNVSFAQVDLKDACIYSGEDAEVSLRLCQCLLQELAKEPTLKQLFFADEMPLLQVLFKMECAGAYVSAEELAKQNSKLKAQMLAVQSDVFSAAGQRFNLASPKQLGQVLFGDMQIPYPKKGKSKTGNYSTSEEVLQEIAPRYDIANLILRYRALSKLISTYTEKLPALIDRRRRIYTSFNQAGTVTFRLSSSDPNLQNIPARTEEGKQVRRAFCAPPGYKILSADYSQIELRLIAHIAKVPNLINAFLKHQDIHRSTAAEVLGKDIAEVTDAERSHAKATNFGLMYGMSAHGLAKQTGMSYKQAVDYVQRYFTRYPQVKQYMQAVKDEAHRHGYVTALLGHRISFAGINSEDARQQSSAERAAINAPMQGSAAEIIRRAMLAVDKWIDALPPDTVRLTLQVHDELVFEVKEDFVQEASAKIKELMESVVTLDVPLEVGIGVADNWADAH